MKFYCYMIRYTKTDLATLMNEIEQSYDNENVYYL